MKIAEKYYQWLQDATGLPKMVLEAMRIGKLNTNEVPGPKSNSEIMALAKAADVSDIYKGDEVAWCAVAHSAIALAAGKSIPFTGYDRLRAVSFRKFGSHADTPMLGDTLVFNRSGGYHVGIYIGEDDKCFHVAGGNQGNQYSIIRIEKARLLEARRPEYKTGIPTGVQQIFLSAEGAISTNEA